MDIEATRTAATQLLDNYYQIHTSDLPTQRTKSQWQAENKRGLFLGIIQEGEDSHIIKLHHLLATNQFTQQQEFSTTSQLADPQHPRTFIDDMFARYILPFHKDYSDSSSCHTPLSSNPPSRSNSAEDLDYVPEERELTHKDLKKAVEKRDGVCLFCWGNKQLEAAHNGVRRTIPPAASRFDTETSNTERLLALQSVPRRIRPAAAICGCSGRQAGSQGGQLLSFAERREAQGLAKE